MANQKIPEGMIPIEEFGKRKGIKKEKVISMIKDGFYIGRVIDEEWYVEQSELKDSNKTIASNKPEGYQSDYDVARKISEFISFLGWVVFAIGVTTAFICLISGTQSRYGEAVSFLAILPGLGVAISGLFLVAAGQVTRATVDNADHTREILKVVREKA